MINRLAVVLVTGLALASCQQQASSQPEASRTAAALCTAGAAIDGKCIEPESPVHIAERKARLERDLGHSKRKSDDSLKF